MCYVEILACGKPQFTIMATGDSNDNVIEMGKRVAGEADNQSGEEEFSDIDYQSEDRQYLDTTEQCSASLGQSSVNDASMTSSIAETLESPLKKFKETGSLTQRELSDLYKPLFVEKEEQSKAVQFIQEEFDLQTSAEATDNISSLILVQVGRVLFHVLGKRFLLLYNIHPTGHGEEGEIRNGSDEQQLLSHPTAHLILWAILFDRQRTLLDLLHQSRYPMGFALLSATIYQRLSELSRRDDRQLSTSWKLKARAMEKFACDITDRLSYQGRNSGISAVGERMDMFEKCDDDGNSYPGLLFSPAEIALEGRLKTFLATSAVQSYMRRVFYNEIDIHRRFWIFLPLFWLPPLPILLARPWGLIKYNHGKYLEHVENKECDTIPDSLFFNLIQHISPLPRPSLHGVWRHKPSCVRKYLVNSSLYNYYTAPVNVYQYYLISHFCLLILFTYTLVRDMEQEWVVAVWFASFFISDIHQMLSSSSSNAFGRVSDNSIKIILQSTNWNLPERTSIRCDSRALHTLQNWLSDEWHFLDLGIYILFLLGFTIHHLTSAGSGLTRAFYASAILLAYGKLMRFCVLWKTVATNSIRIYLIARKLIPLFFILLIVAVGFGVAYISVIQPLHAHNQSPEQSTYMIFFRPFWHIFGAMQLENMHYEMKAAARNACLEEDFNMWDPGKWTSCYTGWMAPIFTALFVFLANLVLFTYIIGVVSHYYGKTKEKTERIWATEILKLIDWSAQLPLPPPPLNIVWFIVRFLLTFILLVYIGVLWIVRKRKLYDVPEELMVNYPGCFSTYVHILWMLTWFYQTPHTNYTKSTSQKRLLVEKVMADMDSREVLSPSTSIHC